jgi:hypothetical protein
MNVLVLAGGAPLITLSLVAAGCGGSKAPVIASLTTASSTTTTSPSAAASSTESRAALATCLTSHGFRASVGSPGSTDSGNVVSVFGVTITGGVDPTSPQFQAAMQACRKYLPGGGPPQMSPAQQAEARRAMSAFAACMRKHGVPSFPEPGAGGMLDPGALQGLDLSSPQAEAAAHTCQSLLPKAGPRLRLPGMG